MQSPASILIIVMFFRRTPRIRTEKNEGIPFEMARFDVSRHILFMSFFISEYRLSTIRRIVNV
jgi:hypothetical protein